MELKCWLLRVYNTGIYHGMSKWRGHWHEQDGLFFKDELDSGHLGWDFRNSKKQADIDLYLVCLMSCLYLYRPLYQRLWAYSGLSSARYSHNGSHPRKSLYPWDLASISGLYRHTVSAPFEFDFWYVEPVAIPKIGHPAGWYFKLSSGQMIAQIWLDHPIKSPKTKSMSHIGVR